MGESAQEPAAVATQEQVDHDEAELVWITQEVETMHNEMFFTSRLR